MTALDRAYPALAAMEKHGVVLSLHGEVTDADVDIFDRERVFVERASRARSCATFRRCSIVLEHITTREAAEFVAAAPRERRRDDHAAAPPLVAQRALRRRPAPASLLPADPEARDAPRRRSSRAATSGSPKFFLGTDSAPHARHTKETRVLRRRLLLGAARARRSTRRRSRTPARSTGSRASRATSARTSTACRATPTR